MKTLLVGFDSAWTVTNSGAIAGLVQSEDGTFIELDHPRSVSYPEAQELIFEWQTDVSPENTVIMLDQPTIVKNIVRKQRPVENIVSSPVGLRYGGVQPAYISKEEMFGKDAPIWPFLSTFGGPADPMNLSGNTWVFETYPVLAMIALQWTLPDVRKNGRLPKYNPERKTFTAIDWRHVCERTAANFNERGLYKIVRWIESVMQNPSPSKSEQDRLDACICLLVALNFSENKSLLMVGDMETGYMIVPFNSGLRNELDERCLFTGRIPSQWVREFRKAQIDNT